MESGRKSKRPELDAALKCCRKHNASLVVARTDRLSRNVHFLSGLLEQKIEFVACDNPHATNFTLHIMAAVAEQEALLISERTKAALAAAKARGVKLGTHGKVLGEKAKAEANVFANVTKAVLEASAKELRKASKKVSFGALANVLNKKKIKTARGGSWHASTVKNISNRIGFVPDTLRN